MIDATSLLRGLRELLDNCGVVEGFDKAVMYMSNKSRREATVAMLHKVVQGVDYTYRKRAIIPILTGDYLVRVVRNAVGGFTLTLEPYTSICMGLDLNGESWLNQIDGGGTRYTYYREFGERVQRLCEEVLKGNLDQILGLNPSKILYDISGLRGELLSVIGCDPLKGETFTRFANDPFQKSLRDISLAADLKARSIVKAEEAIIDSVKKFFPTVTYPISPTQIDSKYHSSPAPLPIQDLSQLDDIPGDLPNSDTESEWVRKANKSLMKAKIIKIYGQRN
jgi:hypothetical protein